MPARTTLVGSGMVVVEKVPVFDAKKGGKVVPDVGRAVVRPENESAKLRPTEAAIAAWSPALSDVKVTVSGGCEA